MGTNDLDNFYYFPILCKLPKGRLYIGARVHNNRGGGKCPILYTAAKHTVLSYDTIGC